MKFKPAIDLPLMEEGEGRIVLFYPNVPENARKYVYEQLGTRWIGQGPAVERFEQMFSQQFGGGMPAISVGSGTDALHLSYILADVKQGDEVIVPLFTCTATNIPLLYQGAKPVFADIQPDTMNIDPVHVKKLVNAKTKAIVCVHYGGLPCDMDELKAIAAEHNIPLIEDAAHALGATYKGQIIGSISDMTMYSFQAIKHITTGDGGMLIIKNKELIPKAKRVRWFGIDREGKQGGHWDNDIWEVGYKYQMTDIAACMGIAGLETFQETLAHRQRLFSIYQNRLSNIPGLKFVGKNLTDRTHAAWLCTLIVENRRALQSKLLEHKIESNQVHYRNDRYSIFKESRSSFPVMDEVEDKYLVVPLHNRLTEQDVHRVCDVISSGW